VIERIEFKNFKVLRDTALDLKPFTLVVGPNGSGKSTIGQALRVLSGNEGISPRLHQSVGVPDAVGNIQLKALWQSRSGQRVLTAGEWYPSGGGLLLHHAPSGDPMSRQDLLFVERREEMRTFQFDPRRIREARSLRRSAGLEADGADLVVVLDQLRDKDEAAYERLNDDIARRLPEFDRVQFDTPHDGQRSLLLRTKIGRHAVPISEVSDGTVLALAYFALPYLPSPPRLIFIEEPEHGLHPRLLRDVRDALFQLSHPADGRPPIQVIATTHSPYFLDLFKDHLEDVVVANKKGNEATFEPLKSQPHISEILGDAPLGAAWYSGVLGGVPTSP